MIRTARKHERVATARQIREAVGSLDDEVIMAILNTDATLAEIVRAYEWEEEDGLLAPVRKGRKVASSWLELFGEYK